jgi:enoyl-[acyl-carrier-protein] reductase (NADH)
MNDKDDPRLPSLLTHSLCFSSSMQLVGCSIDSAKTTLSFCSIIFTYSFSSLSRFSSSSFVSCSVENGKDDPLLLLFDLYLLIFFPLPLLQLQLISCSVERYKDDPRLFSILTHSLCFSSFMQLVGCSVDSVKTTLFFCSIIFTYSFSSLSRFSSSSLSATTTTLSSMSGSR